MERYPDSIIITLYGDPEQDSDGNYGAPPVSATHSSDCRFQPAGRANIIKGDDGEEIAFSYLVFMPLVESRFNFGDAIEGQHHSGYTITGKIKRHHNTQHHTKLWV